MFHPLKKYRVFETNEEVLKLINHHIFLLFAPLMMFWNQKACQRQSTCNVKKYENLSFQRFQARKLSFLLEVK